MATSKESNEIIGMSTLKESNEFIAMATFKEDRAAMATFEDNRNGHTPQEGRCWIPPRCPASYIMKIINGGVTAARGFLASAIYCGIRHSISGLKSRPKRDLALIYSEVPALTAGVFTTNKVQSGSIKLTKFHLEDNKAQAIIVNSGNANCCNGPGRAFEDAKSIASRVGRCLGIEGDDVLVASTGIIGKTLPMAKINAAIPKLIEMLDGGKSRDAASAIMTTDTFPKEVAVRLRVADKYVTIGGIAKGAGMIFPHMATMLCFLTTDASITAGALKEALRLAVEKSFNSITVDGDTSTNDMVLVMANGLAENSQIRLNREGSFNQFCEGLGYVTETLSHMIVRDGEGATKFIEVQVSGAKTTSDAKMVASSICNSNLVKTAFFGKDPNWGRIAAAVGSSGAEIKEDRMQIRLGRLLVFKNGSPQPAWRPQLKRIMHSDKINVSVELKVGNKSARMWTCDFSPEYVKINAKYMA